MAEFAYKGTDERVFPYPRALTVSPGDVIEADENPDELWFEERGAEDSDESGAEPAAAEETTEPAAAEETTEPAAAEETTEPAAAETANEPATDQEATPVKSSEESG